MATCYRHPDRETGVSCSNCGRPICPDCMTPTPVGMRCPECSRDRTPVRNMASLYGAPVLTYVLIGINVVCSSARAADSKAYFDLVLAAGPVANGDIWRAFTGGFLHAQGAFGFLHIGFNMYLLYILGNLLEPSIGKLRFGAIYFTSLLTGSFGAILLSSPNSYTVGASGAVFGLMGAAVVFLHARGINPMQIRARPDDPHQPAVPVPVPRRQHLDRRAHLRPGRRLGDRLDHHPRGGAPHAGPCCRSSPAS